MTELTLAPSSRRLHPVPPQIWIPALGPSLTLITFLAYAYRLPPRADVTGRYIIALMASVLAGLASGFMTGTVAITIGTNSETWKISAGGGLLVYLFTLLYGAHWLTHELPYYTVFLDYAHQLRTEITERVYRLRLLPRLMPGPRNVSGDVIDASLRSSVRGVQMQLLEETSGKPERHVTVTDEFGNFRFDDIDGKRTYRLAPMCIQCQPDPPTALIPSGASAEERHFMVRHPLQHLVFQATDPAGGPASRVGMRIIVGSKVLQFTTDDEGRFDFDAEIGRKYLLTASDSYLDFGEEQISVNAVTPPLLHPLHAVLTAKASVEQKVIPLRPLIGGAVLFRHTTGTRIRKGDVVAEIDIASQKTNIASLTASMEAIRVRNDILKAEAGALRSGSDAAGTNSGVGDDARQAVTMAKTNLERLQELARQGLIPRMQADAARQKLAVAREKLARVIEDTIAASNVDLSAKTDTLTSLQTQVNHAAVIASAAGTLSTSVDEGAIVSPGLTIGELRPLAGVVIHCPVPAKYISMARRATDVVITDPISGLRVHGTVERVAANEIIVRTPEQITATSVQVRFDTR